MWENVGSEAGFQSDAICAQLNSGLLFADGNALRRVRERMLTESTARSDVGVFLVATSTADNDEAIFAASSNRRDRFARSAMRVP